jgi:hypothetical protein
MPFMDGTGPLGDGPGSGRGRGTCAGAQRGCGRGLGRGGRGTGRGKGFGQQQAKGAAQDPKTAIKRQLSGLRGEQPSK